MDLWKFYDLIDAPAALDLLSAMGLSPRVATALENFYTRLWRIMTINGVADEGFKSAQSVLQGCAWSNPLALALGTLWADFVECGRLVSARRPLRQAGTPSSACPTQPALVVVRTTPQPPPSQCLLSVAPGQQRESHLGPRLGRAEGHSHQQKGGPSAASSCPRDQGGLRVHGSRLWRTWPLSK